MTTHIGSRCANRSGGRRFALAGMASSLALLCASTTHAQSYFPLAVGNTWHYESAKLGTEVQSITRTDVILGRTVYVNSYSESKLNDGLDQYWQENEDGDILLAGFFRKLDDWGILYDPPLVWLDAPLALGRTWITQADYYTLPGVIPAGSIEIGLEVYEAGPLTVPAGTYPCYGIGQFSVPANSALALSPYALDGTVRTAGSNATDWYSPGVGDVQYDLSSPFQLVSFEFPTPVAMASWGRIKSAYR